MMSGFFRKLALLLAALLILFGSVSAESGELFSYRILDDGSAMITGYKGYDDNLVFPDIIDGYPVSALGRSFTVNTPSIKSIKSITIPNAMTVIEPGALQFAEYLAEIVIAGDHPVLSFSDGVLYDRVGQRLLLYLQGNTAEHFDVPDGVRVIEEKAFFRSRLVSVHIPGSVERIGCESFYQCTQLRELTLSEGLKTIDKDALTNCDKLQTITIPASVTDISEQVFTDSHLTEIRVAPDNPVFVVSDGALINIRDSVLIAYPEKSEAESCVVPEGVTRIGSYAFYRAHNLKEIILPDGLLEIGSGAFLLCNHLKAINLPDSVVKLEYTAFGSNSDVEFLHLSAGLTEIVDNFDDLNITELEIPKGVTLIKGSFRSLPRLTKVVLPGTVTIISDNSFTFCKKLEAITIPASVTDIRSNFIGCSDALVIRVAPGSFAEQFCEEHHLKHENISE